MDFFFSKLAPIISCIVAVIMLVLGILAYRSDRKSWANRAFFSLTVFTAAWSLAVIARFSFFKDPYLILLSAKATFAASTVVALLLYYVTYYSPVKNRYKSPYVLLIVSAVILFLLSLFSPFVVNKIEFDNGIQHASYGFAYYIFSAYFLGLIFFDAYNLVSKRKFLNSIQRKQMYFFLIGFFISASLALSTNVFLPLLTGIAKISMLGPSMVIFFIIATSYAILKHHLFNIKVITTEIFSVLMALTLLVNALLSETANEIILNLSLFVAISFFAILLIRSVLKEVEAKEELAALSEKLQKANEDLQKLDKAKSEFISIASHQLRTPLSIIKGFVSMMLEKSYGEITDKQKDILNKIYASNERLVHLINDLLDLSRMEGGRMKFDWGFHLFSEIIESVVDEFKSPAQNKNLILRWTNEAPQIMYVRADKEKLRQVVLNLVDNAIKYTNQGSVEVKLVKTKEGMARLSVSDTGIGIDKAELDALFGKFVRGKNVPKLWTEGTGLGLYVARKMIDEHKGKIWGESAGEGRGSTFFLELPVY